MHKSAQAEPEGPVRPSDYLVVSGENESSSSKPFVAMHLDIQLYESDPGVYLVDFKCSGYETSHGKLLEEKEVTSPYPFLDMAAKLIMQLADAD
jgi:carbon catabolite-derepressing protein kinase